MIALYALRTYFKVTVASSRYHQLRICTEDNPIDTDHVMLPDVDYVLHTNSVPDENYVLRSMENVSLDCLSYFFATVRDIKRVEYKYTAEWFKLLNRKRNAGLTHKKVYKPIAELNYRYYRDFECTQHLASDIVLFDLPMLDTLGGRRIYRRIFHPTFRMRCAN